MDGALETAPIARSNRQAVTGAILSVWRANRVPLFIFLGTRAALMLMVYISLALLPLNNAPRLGWHGFPDNLFLDGWARWDAGQFASVVEGGYYWNPPGTSNIPFFPLYPAAIRLVNLVFENTFLSGIVISNLASLGSTILLYHLAARRFSRDVAGRAVLLLLVFPFSIYFAAVYSEALFCFFVILTFYLAEQERWPLAGLAGLLAGLTRTSGIVLAPALVLLYLQKRNFHWREVRSDILWVILASMGTVLYFAYLYFQFKDPLLYFHVIQSNPNWSKGRDAIALLAELRQFMQVKHVLTGEYNVAVMFNVGMGLVFLLTTPAVIRRQGAAYGALTLLLLALAMGGWYSTGRYVLAAFPVYIAWALWLRNRWAFEVVLVAFSLLLALCAIVYSHWYWLT